mgnify:CR=1 FL=1
MEESNGAHTSKRENREGGCLTVGAGSSLLLWLGIVPIALVGGVNAIGASLPWPAIIALLGFTALLLPPALLVAYLARRAERRALAATATAVALIGGYLVLDATARLILPDNPNGAAALRLLLLLPYVALTAYLARQAHLSMFRLAPATRWLGLTVAAVLTVPWPLTGALGDSLTSLGLLFQISAAVVPLVGLIWGLIFPLLTASYDQAWLAAVATIWLYEAALIGGVLPQGDWGVLSRALFLLPLALLLTELRARGRGIWPLLPVALLYEVLPPLFTDPRDVIGQGIPEIQHLLAYAFAWITALILGLGLWGGRKLIAERRPSRRRPRIGWLPALFWVAWLAAYVFLGNPGFANDGFLILLEEQADVSAAYEMSDRVERLSYVRETLIETAERSQAPVRAELDRLGVPYRPYYVMNMIRVEGHRWRMGHFERQPGVAEVILNPNVRDYPYRLPVPSSAASPVTGTQANLLAIHADAAWANDVTGAGIVVAGQDTGYDWEHPALQPHYRGWDGETATHDYHWLDTWDHAAVPFDDDTHGTHTMGTVLGDDGGQNRIGVAPDARWIGCRNMRRGLGNPSTYAACMEFFLAPYPVGGDSFQDGDVRYVPHVVNNSWGCPSEEGCFADTLRPAVEALRAAGVMMVVSAGNDGPACQTATTPPANYDAVFSVGATSNVGIITSFSSRGPVDGLLKPDITAPGRDIVSSVPGRGYSRASGTSMAGPHVAGAVALLWSAQPALIGDMDATEALLCETAQPRPVDNSCQTVGNLAGKPTVLDDPVTSLCACGDVTGTPNNVYGCGNLDAGEAVRAALGMSE